MRKGYVTKRIASGGYVAVTKPLAQALYDKGVTVTLCGNNVNSFHVSGGWGLGCSVNRGDENKTDYDGNAVPFETLVSNFLYYLEKGLGTYLVFYVQQHAVKEA